MSMPNYTPVTTREVVRRMTVDRWTPREIASHLGISRQAVYDHLQKLDMTPARKGDRDAAS